MNQAFKNIDNQDIKAPEALKGMLVAEVDTIRDAMQLVQLFIGEPFLAATKMMQELEPNQRQNL